jgi:hypothetical protein
MVSFTLRPLYLLIKSFGTHWIGGWVGLKAGLGAVASRKENIIASIGNRNPVVQPVA